MKNRRLFISVFLLAISTLACVPLGLRQQATPNSAELVLTAAAETIAVEQTLEALNSTPIVPITGEGEEAEEEQADNEPQPDEPTQTVTTTPTITPTDPPTATPTQTATPICDLATFITDVSIPDGTVLSPGEVFTKTWRIKNIGSCTWNTSYEAVFINGDQMGGPNDLNLTGNVYPDQTVDITVSFTAPAAAGTYKGNWKLRNASAAIFGLSNGNPFYVEIEVANIAPLPDPPPTIIHNFTSNFCDGDWNSYPPYQGLPCPGTTSDPEGFVVLVGNPRLETGDYAGAPALETHPRWVDDGLITGLFPPIIIHDGYRFQSTIGCRYHSVHVCDVVYQLNYYVDGDHGTLHPLGNWSETYDGSMTELDIDLSFLDGHSIEFAFVVRANGSSEKDWALWIDPRIIS
ncbi:MAG: hypothetical protein JEZ06_03900 [Anaerolineaceae bacterium]|nr:hypothetical protein [Anaerolineaceae bacterium]